VLVDVSLYYADTKATADPMPECSPRARSQRYAHPAILSSLPFHLHHSRLLYLRHLPRTCCCPALPPDSIQSLYHERQTEPNPSTLGLRPHRLRELRGRCRGRWKTRRACPLGYGWSGRLRQTTTSIIPRLSCHPDLFRRRFPRFPRQRPREGKQPTSIPLEPNSQIQQWISEVLHFCQGLPIILVGCKSDLRQDPKTIEELAKTSQKPVTLEQVR
jgi:hypothetical protein